MASAPFGRTLHWSPVTFTLELMRQSLEIIDRFVASEANRPEGLSPGTWYVLDGQFLNCEELPGRGVTVDVRTPSGESLHTTIVEVEVRHGSAALRFFPEPNNFPRSSILEFSSLREYQALISAPGPLDAAFRTSVCASNLDDAKARLEVEYGAGKVLSLWNEEDADKPRGAGAR